MSNNLAFISMDEKIVDNKDVPYVFVNDFTVESAKKFYLDFQTVAAKPYVKVIPIIINSYGGQVHSLLAMVDVINSSSKPVATIAMGAAMSCGAVLLACGSPGMRYAAPNTDIMVHEVSGVNWGKTADVKNDAIHTNFLNEKLFDLLLDRSTNKKKKDLLKKIKKNANVDWFLTSEEFKELGLIDHAELPNLTQK